MQRIALDDAVYLHNENLETQVNTVMLVDLFPESAATSDELLAGLRVRAEQIPELRQSIVSPYGRIGDSYWVELPTFDIGHHVFLDEAVGWEQVHDRLLALRARPYAPDRPQWETHVFRNVAGIPGLSGPHIAVATKYHHAMGEPGYFSDITARLYAPEPPSAPDPSTGRVRRHARLTVTARELVKLPLRPFLMLGDMVASTRTQQHLTRALAETGQGAAPVPRCSITQSSGSNVDFGTLLYPRARLRTIAATLDASANDVIMAAIGAAIADQVDDLRSADITSIFAVSARTADTASRNRIRSGIISLSPERPLPDRARRIHHAIRALRTVLIAPEHQVVSPRAPGFFYDWYWQRQQSSQGSLAPAHTRVSSFPPPDVSEWRFGGNRPKARLSVLLPGSGLGLCHAVTTLGDYAAINAFVDPDQVPDLAGYLARLQSRLDQMLPAAAA